MRGGGSSSSAPCPVAFGHRKGGSDHELTDCLNFFRLLHVFTTRSLLALRSGLRLRIPPQETKDANMAFKRGLNWLTTGLALVALTVVTATPALAQTGTVQGQVVDGTS